ncbi:hypothetical protein RHOSPDRAFT_31355 [Rhodotorula sp. JG-1b]|nr:hypothetical protein RHOSPDRAFT_31355 [Rhodotorula sp. JG-1b]
MLPRAQPGPNGTAQYLNGWFALDGPSRAGWSRSDSRPPSYVSTPGQEDEPEDTGAMRDPHFSRAQRAARRAKAFLRRTKGGTSADVSAGAKGKKKPRSSRTTEAAQLEQDAGQEMWSEAVAPK